MGSFCFLHDYEVRNFSTFKVDIILQDKVIFHRDDDSD